MERPEESLAACDSHLEFISPRNHMIVRENDPAAIQNKTSAPPRVLSFTATRLRMNHASCQLFVQVIPTGGTADERSGVQRQPRLGLDGF